MGRFMVDKSLDPLPLVGMLYLRAFGIPPSVPGPCIILALIYGRDNPRAMAYYYHRDFISVIDPGDGCYHCLQRGPFLIRLYYRPILPSSCLLSIPHILHEVGVNPAIYSPHRGIRVDE